MVDRRLHEQEHDLRPHPEHDQSPVVHLMYGSGGGGHRASAEAVRCALAQLPEPPQVFLVDAAALAGAAWGDRLYNRFLANGATPLVSLLHACTAIILPILTPALRASFARFWSSSTNSDREEVHQRPPTPDLVVSFVPQLNAVMAGALAQVKRIRPVPATSPNPLPLLTVLTDFAHTPDHPWLQHEAQHVVCGTTKAAQQCHALLPRAKCTRTSGMVVHPRFYMTESIQNRAATLSSLGLVPDRLTVLLLFGSSPPTSLVKKLVARFAKRPSSSRVNLIVICGSNISLKRDLMDAMADICHMHARTSKRESTTVHTGSDAISDDGQSHLAIIDDSSSAGSLCEHPWLQTNSSHSAKDNAGMLPCHVAEPTTNYKGKPTQMFITGFTMHIAEYMRISDVLIGKPGPGVVTEAFVSRLPCVMLAGIDGRNVMVQERDVLDWLVQAGIGHLVSNANDAAAVSREQIDEMKAAIDRQPPNTAVFEVSRLIAQKLTLPTGPECCSLSNTASDIAKSSVGPEKSGTSRDGLTPSLPQNNSEFAGEQAGSSAVEEVLVAHQKPNSRSHSPHRDGDLAGANIKSFSVVGGRRVCIV